MKNLLIAIIAFAGLTSSWRANGQNVFLSDTTKEYALNVVHTSYQEYTCDIINCVRNDTVFAIRVYDVYADPLPQKIVPEGYIKQAIVNEIAKGAFSVNFDKIIDAFIKNSFSIDTVVLTIQKKTYFITSGFKANVFIVKENALAKTAKFTNSSFFNVLSKGTSSSYISIGNGLQQKSIRKGDTLVVSLLNTHRGKRTSTFTFIDQKGLASFVDLPVLTGVAQMYLQKALDEKKKWDYLSNNEFSFISRSTD